MCKITTMAAKQQANTVSNNYHSLRVLLKWVPTNRLTLNRCTVVKTNGVNINFKTYKDAYDDSPTNASIIMRL
jgi:hypothetical protein